MYAGACSAWMSSLLPMRASPHPACRVSHAEEDISSLGSVMARSRRPCACASNAAKPVRPSARVRCGAEQQGRPGLRARGAARARRARAGADQDPCAAGPHAHGGAAAGRDLPRPRGRRQRALHHAVRDRRRRQGARAARPSALSVARGGCPCMHALITATRPQSAGSETHGILMPALSRAKHFCYALTEHRQRDAWHNASSAPCQARLQLCFQKLSETV